MELTNLFYVLAIAAILFLLYRQLKGGLTQDSNSTLSKDVSAVAGMVKVLSDNMNQLNERVDQRLKENADIIQRTHHSLGERIDNSAKAYADVKGQLSKLEEASKRIFDIGQDISSLQDTLKAPKLRGIWGELYLEELLGDRFSKDQYTMQYTFKSGQSVDAVIHLRDGKLVPIDSKFSLENFRKLIESKSDETKKKAKKAFSSDVKKRIDEIASKYILPDENTLNFALMYIPAENVYYEVIIRDDSKGESLMEYALGKGVFPVSPNTFAIYLTTILSGLRGLEIEEKAQEIMNYLARLRGDFGKFNEQYNLVGGHLNNARNSYERSEKTLRNFQEKLGALDGESKMLE